MHSHNTNIRLKIMHKLFELFRKDNKTGNPRDENRMKNGGEKPYNSGNFGKNVTISYQQKFILGKGSTYNDYCWFNARYGIKIGENTLIGPFVLIHTVNHVIKNINIEQNATGPGSWCENDRNLRVIGEPVVIGNDCWIGSNVTILAGSQIPDKCIIGAGTLIIRSNSLTLRKGDIVVNDLKLRRLGNRQDY